MTQLKLPWWFPIVLWTLWAMELFLSMAAMPENIPFVALVLTIVSIFLIRMGYGFSQFHNLELENILWMTRQTWAPFVLWLVCLGAFAYAGYTWQTMILLGSVCGGLVLGTNWFVRQLVPVRAR